MTAATLLAGVVSSAAGAAVSSRLPRTGYYTRRYRWDGRVVDGRKVQDEDYVEVDLFRSGGRRYLDFAVSRSWPARVLGAVCRAVPDRSGALRFRFEDGWGNLGEGSFAKRRGLFNLRLRVIRKSEGGADVRGLYGSYWLRRVSAHPSMRRHPWSPGR